MPGELILIIEDDVHIGGLVIQVLREAGYRPTVVPCMDVARSEAAAGLVPAAIISDLLVAGGGDPACLADEIGAVFPGVPVTLMTGVPAKRRAHLGVTHDRILEKPFELEGLLGAVRSMLASAAAAAG
jgi:DNA-binding NtrC family response regulator